jgi:putative component of membrane protein insertase Oxa1/YidC/SpoIIIJ protein YidD
VFDLPSVISLLMNKRNDIKNGGYRPIINLDVIIVDTMELRKMSNEIKASFIGPKQKKDSINNILNHALKYRFIKRFIFVGKSCLFVLLCSLVIQACAHTSQNQSESMMANDSFYQGVIEFYRGPLNHLKSVRRGECPMYPSCSEYSRQAIARFGLIKGWIMTTDRLIRCGRDETHLSPKILVNGKWKYYDPIENNDLWSGKTREQIEDIRSTNNSH